jgi:hypothetical protein
LLVFICRSNSGHGKSLAFALNDIFTGTNFAIAAVSALIGYIVFEYLRKMLWGCQRDGNSADSVATVFSDPFSICFYT